MKLADTRYDNRETGCCARLERSRWDGTTHAWDGQKFVTARVHALFHIPLNFGKVMTRTHAAVAAAAAYPEDPLWLSDEISPWRSNLYFAVDREVPGATMSELPGTYLSKVFTGSFSEVGAWTQQMREFVRAQGHEPGHILYYYATCPRCAKRLGANEVVLFAKVQPPPAPTSPARH